MLALRNNSDDGWQNEKVNIRQDFMRLFGEDITEIDGIAIMTDSDNTKSHAIANYSNILLSSE